MKCTGDNISYFDGRDKKDVISIRPSWLHSNTDNLWFYSHFVTWVFPLSLARILLSSPYTHAAHVNANSRKYPVFTRVHINAFTNIPVYLNTT